jgi:hypothetical protein
MNPREYINSAESGGFPAYLLQASPASRDGV